MDNCPNCQSSSGVDVHGRDFCHACGKDFPGKGKDLLPKKQPPRKSLELPVWDPFDCFPDKAYDYLNKFHYVRDERCFWSSKYDRLCFPYYKKDDFLYNGPETMIGCWMRSLDQQPKWKLAGSKDFAWVYFKARKVWESEETEYRLNNTIVLVEDVISAIRVSKYLDCVHLGGTSINKSTEDLLNAYINVYIFLDGDEAGKNGAMKIRNKLKLNYNVRVIRAKKDPKCHTDEELKRILR